MNDIFFTSDTHFGHENILIFGKGRPFANIKEHDEAIIEAWNGRVSVGDRVYHLGDFSFAFRERTEEILSKLNGQIFLVKGNHDKGLKSEKFIWMKEYYRLKVKDEDTVTGTQEIVLFHYPIESWDKRHYGAWHLHGHCHGNLESPPHQPREDVGVDNQGFAPVSYAEIKERMSKKTFKQLDHHSDKRNRK